MLLCHNNLFVLQKALSFPKIEKGKNTPKSYFKLRIIAKLKDKRKPITGTKKWIGGRPTLSESEKRSYCYNFRLNEEENIKFEQLFMKSGASTKTEFITNCIFNKPFHVVTRDASAMDICIKLSETNLQIRSIGNNYNQAVCALKSNFTEKKALSYLYKLEKETIQVVLLLKKIIEITQQYRRQWLPKESEVAPNDLQNCK